MPEQVAVLGVDDFDCITTDTSGSASEEVGADMLAGEADVPAEPSESRHVANEMFYGKELLVLLAHRALRKDPCQHWVERIISFWYSLCHLAFGCSECASSAMVVAQDARSWAEIFRHLQSESAKPLSEVAADHQFLPGVCGRGKERCT